MALLLGGDTMNMDFIKESKIVDYVVSLVLNLDIRPRFLNCFFKFSRGSQKGWGIFIMFDKR